MARIITDDLFAGLVAHLQKDESVRLFQALLVSDKTAEARDAPETADAEDTGVE